MMNERKTLKEFRHELNLSQDKHLIVEGHSDRSFYSAWLDTHDSLDGVSVQVIGTVHVDDDLVRGLGLPDGERSRVIALASQAQDYPGKLLCIADRDTGVGVDEFQFKTLAWTDFPALESYVMHPKLFRIAHQVCLQGKIKDADSLHRELASALFRLWRVRIANPHLERPNYKSGIKKGGGLASFDVGAAIGFGVQSTDDGNGVSASLDARSFSYGHDIAHLLFAAYASQIKTKLHFSSEDALERSLCAAILGTRELASEALFVHLWSWIGSKAVISA